MYITQKITYSLNILFILMKLIQKLADGKRFEEKYQGSSHSSDQTTIGVTNFPLTTSRYDPIQPVLGFDRSEYQKDLLGINYQGINLSASKQLIIIYFYITVVITLQNS